MDNLDFEFKIREEVLDHENNLLALVLKNSHGQPTMSDEDVKLAVLALQGQCRYQLQLIEALRTEIQELKKPKKTILQKLFRK